MIYSRSPEQYDPTPFLDDEGRRFSKGDAPRGAKWTPRLYLTPTDDIEPVLDEGYKRLSKASVEELLQRNPEVIKKLTWAPRSGEYLRHNQILASIRNTLGDNVKKEVYGLWLTTLEEFPHETLMALSPGLDERKISEAKTVLSRLLRAYEEVL